MEPTINKYNDINYNEFSKFVLSNYDVQKFDYRFLNTYIYNVIIYLNNIKNLSNINIEHVSSIYKFFTDLTFFKNIIISIIPNSSIIIKREINELNNNYINELENIYNNKDKNANDNINNINIFRQQKEKNIEKTFLLNDYDENKSKIIIQYLINILIELNKIHKIFYEKLNDTEKENYIPGFYNNNKETYYDSKLFNNLDIDYHENNNILPSVSTSSSTSTFNLSTTSSQQPQTPYQYITSLQTTPQRRQTSVNII